MRFLKTLLLRAGPSLAIFLRALTRPHTANCLLVPPAPPGSMGDEAMLRGSLEALRLRRARRVGILCFAAGERWNVGDPGVEQVFVPGLWEWRSTSGLIKLCLLSVRYPTILFIGADCLDGAYGMQRELPRLELARYAARCARRAVIGCFSFGLHPDPGVVDRIKALPTEVYFRPRDRLSLQRFSAATGKSAVLTADLAFLLRPDTRSAQASVVGRRTAAQRDLGRIVVGLNLNRLFLRLVPDGEAAAVALVTSVARRDERFVFVLIPHDSRSEDSDETLHSRLFEALPETLRDRVIQVPSLESAAAVKAVTADLDFLVSQRMHLAIAALGSGVPVLCCEYQDKAEGMLAHFDQSDMVVRPDEFAAPGRLADRIVAAVNDRSALRAKIHAALPRVLELAHGVLH
jgi:polysaccharide pyruvyl transferase WcaK-like protein